MNNNECITVVVRCRPMNRKENEENRKNIIEVDSESRQVGIRNPENLEEQPKFFTFDATYGDKTQQRIFYEESCFGIIESTLEGFNSTIFAYGQTGCGKSFTMQGPSTTDENLRGVIPNSFEHIFQFVKTTKDVEFLIRCSYLELYNEEVRDLLGNPKANVKCELKEDPKKGIYIKGLTDVVVESPEDLNKMLDKGLSNRTVAATLMNSESSRSHSIFTIIVEMSTKDAATGKDMLRVGKLNLVDLAGSERAKKTGATDQTLKEGIRINLSLSVLGNVISALAEGSKHIPYRDSKLTRLLQDSLGGNTKTMMVAAISPADYNFEETMSTLRYANRAKNIKNKPKINEDPKDTMIREFKAEIERLRKLLAEQASTAALHSQLSSNGAPALSIENTFQINDSASNVNDVPERANIILLNSPVAHPTTVSQMEAAASPLLPTKEDTVDSLEKSAVPNVTDFKYESAGITVAVTHENLTDEGVLPSVQVELFENYTQEAEPVQQQQQLEYNVHQPEVASGASQTNTPRWVSAADGTLPGELEQQMRDEIENRLHQLEHMLVTSEEAIIRSSPTKEKNNESISTKTPEEQAEEERSLKEYKEKKLLAKKRRDEKQQREMQRVLEEKRQLAEELEELKQSLLNEKNNSSVHDSIPSKPSSAVRREVGDVDNIDSDEIENSAMKKLTRLRKRYEKKLNAAKEELEDLREDFYFQRKQLMDAMLEQEKDAKLYELICKSILSEKDLKKIIEKCRYDEENDQWVIPFSKKKSLESVESSPPISSSINFPQSNARQSSSLLPDIHQLPHQSGSKMQSVPIEQKFSSLQNSPWLLNVPVDNSRPSSQSHLKRVPNLSNNKMKEVNTATVKKVVPVPLLTLPGSLVTASSLMTPHDTEQISSRSEFGDTNNLPGIGYDEKKKKSNPSKNKIPKVTSLPAPNNARIASIGNFNIDNTMGNIDEIGTGEVAGPLDDWGFASKPLKSSRLNPSSGYDENGYEVEDVNVKKKKTRQSRNSRSGMDDGITSSSYSGGSLLPPIDHKYGTPRLPPI